MGGPLNRRSLCLFWRETEQRPELKISTRLEVGKGTPKERQELDKGTQRRQLATVDGEGQLAVDTGQQKRPVDMRESPASVREDQSK